MAGQFTTGERRGMIALLAIMAVVVAIMLWRGTGRIDAEAISATARPSIDSVAATVDADTSRHSRHKRRNSHRSGRKRDVKSKPTREIPAGTTRSPLDEHNN